MIILFIITIFFTQVNTQSEDLIKQVDGVFTKLNSNGTAKIITNIFENLEEMIDRVNSDATQERTNEIFNNINEILQTFNSNESREIIHNLRILTENSKVYIDVNDSNWNTNKLIIYVEIILSLIIIILVFLFSLCIFKVVKNCRNKEKPLQGIDLYNPLTDVRLA